MAIMASWGSKSWEVSKEKITALNGLNASLELDTKNNDDKAGSPPTQTKALKLQTLTFDFDVAGVAGCDVRSEYESWTELIGECAPFYLAGSRFGPPKLQLTRVALGNSTIDAIGRIVKGKISITLTEYAAEASSQKSSGSKSSGLSISKSSSPASASTYDALGISGSAANIGASSSDKAAKKPSNSQL